MFGNFRFYLTNIKKNWSFAPYFSDTCFTDASLDNFWINWGFCATVKFTSFFFSTFPPNIMVIQNYDNSNTIHTKGQKPWSNEHHAFLHWWKHSDCKWSVLTAVAHVQCCLISMLEVPWNYSWAWDFQIELAALNFQWSWNPLMGSSWYWGVSVYIFQNNKGIHQWEATHVYCICKFKIIQI